MKILWFTNTPSNYKQKASTCQGGGWISSLEKEIANSSDIELGISFFHTDECFKTCENQVTYYPIKRSNSLFKKARRFFCLTSQDSKDISLYLRVIEDFKPDLIHIFGTESSFGLLCKHTEIPVVIHLQGLMAPCLNAWAPPFYSLGDYFLSGGWSPKQIALRIRAWRFNQHAAAREKQIMRICKHFMGRTEWDKTYCSLYAPQATYHHCDEMLRDTFYESGKRTIPAIPTFVSTLSGPLYKGHDLVLKTAQVLIECGLSDFSWDIYGIQSMRFAERKTNIQAANVKVQCKGVATAEEIKTALLHCTAYIHPSYIDNSPNSLCEAQICGVPPIACNVGGISSLLENDISGILLPANDPYALAGAMMRVARDKNQGKNIGEAAQQTAKRKHNRSLVLHTVYDIYKQIVAGTSNQRPLLSHLLGCRD